MTQRTLPGMGLTAFWPLGYDGYNAELDENIRSISAVAQLTVLARVTAAGLPGSPTHGMIYILTDDANVNNVALYDTDTWVYLAPQVGWRALDIGAGGFIVFNGTSWVNESVFSGAAGAPAGAVMEFAGAEAPTGWLMCDGAAVSRSEYAALFTAIGTTWGIGDGSSTFNLPNRSGRVGVGAGSERALTNMDIVSTNASTDLVTTGAPHNLQTGDTFVYRLNGGTAISGMVDGNTYYVIKKSATTFQIASSQANAIAGSFGNIGTTAPTAGTNNIEIAAAAARTLGEVGGRRSNKIFPDSVAGTPKYTMYPRDSDATAFSAQDFWPQEASDTENMPPFVVMNYIIKT